MSRLTHALHLASMVEGGLAAMAIHHFVAHGEFLFSGGLLVLAVAVSSGSFLVVRRIEARSGRGA